MCKRGVSGMERIKQTEMLNWEDLCRIYLLVLILCAVFSFPLCHLLLSLCNIAHCRIAKRERERRHTAALVSVGHDESRSIICECSWTFTRNHINHRDSGSHHVVRGVAVFNHFFSFRLATSSFFSLSPVSFVHCLSISLCVSLCVWFFSFYLHLESQSHI